MTVKFQSKEEAIEFLKSKGISEKAIPPEAFDLLSTDKETKERAEKKLRMRLKKEKESFEKKLRMALEKEVESLKRQGVPEKYMPPWVVEGKIDMSRVYDYLRTDRKTLEKELRKNRRRLRNIDRRIRREKDKILEKYVLERLSSVGRYSLEELKLLLGKGKDNAVIDPVQYKAMIAYVTSTSPEEVFIERSDQNLLTLFTLLVLNLVYYTKKYESIVSKFPAGRAIILEKQSDTILNTLDELFQTIGRLDNNSAAQGTKILRFEANGWTKIPLDLDSYMRATHGHQQRALVKRVFHPLFYLYGETGDFLYTGYIYLPKKMLGDMFAEAYGVLQGFYLLALSYNPLAREILRRCQDAKHKTSLLFAEVYWNNAIEQVQSLKKLQDLIERLLPTVEDALKRVAEPIGAESEGYLKRDNINFQLGKLLMAYEKEAVTLGQAIIRVFLNTIKDDIHGRINNLKREFRDELYTDKRTVEGERVGKRLTKAKAPSLEGFKEGAGDTKEFNFDYSLIELLHDLDKGLGCDIALSNSEIEELKALLAGKDIKEIRPDLQPRTQREHREKLKKALEKYFSLKI